MEQCTVCGRRDPALTEWTTRCPECSDGYAVYACQSCKSECGYRADAAPDLPQVLRGLCGFCYRRSLADSLSEKDRASVRALALAGDKWKALDAVEQLLDVTGVEAWAVAHELTKIAEPGVAADRAAVRSQE
jgi:hypothetical protein